MYYGIIIPLQTSWMFFLSLIKTFFPSKLEIEPSSPNFYDLNFKQRVKTPLELEGQEILNHQTITTYELLFLFKMCNDSNFKTFTLLISEV